jgi:hypothetical protein
MSRGHADDLRLPGARRRLAGFVGALCAACAAGVGERLQRRVLEQFALASLRRVHRYGQQVTSVHRDVAMIKEWRRDRKLPLRRVRNSVLRTVEWYARLAAVRFRYRQRRLQRHHDDVICQPFLDISVAVVAEPPALEMFVPRSKQKPERRRGGGGRAGQWCGGGCRDIAEMYGVRQRGAEAGVLPHPSTRRRWCYVTAMCRTCAPLMRRAADADMHTLHCGLLVCRRLQLLVARRRAGPRAALQPTTRGFCRRCQPIKDVLAAALAREKERGLGRPPPRHPNYRVDIPPRAALPVFVAPDDPVHVMVKRGLAHRPSVEARYGAYARVVCGRCRAAVAEKVRLFGAASRTPEAPPFE